MPESKIDSTFDLTPFDAVKPLLEYDEFTGWC